MLQPLEIHSEDSSCSTVSDVLAKTLLTGFPSSHSDENQTHSKRLISYQYDRVDKSKDVNGYLQEACSSDSTKSTPRKPQRILPEAPERILDAPDLLDDYYLNLMDWSSSGILAICLGSAVFMWNSTTGDTCQLLNTEDSENPVTSISWMNKDEIVAVGFNDATTQIWDANKQRPIRTLGGHHARVCSLSFNPVSPYLLSTGSKDYSIINHDIRAQESNLARLVGHSQEVCGLKWSPDGSWLASGGNDNLLLIWNQSSLAPRQVFREHKAA